MSDNPLQALLVEDNPGDARLIWEMLTEVKSAAFDVEYADRLSSGLERLAAGGIDVVLLDLSLPDSQGLDTFARVHAQAPQLPIIVLTRTEDDDIGMTAVKAGAQEYLVKDRLDRRTLPRTILHAMVRHRRMARVAALRRRQER